MDGKSLSQQVYDKLKEDIISLKYQPGEFLTEREIANDTGVSRTPVREAIQRLSQEFWLTSGDGKRLQIRPVTLNDVNEIIQIRNIVEYSAIDYAIKHGQARAVAGQLDFILTQMKNITDRYDFTTMDLNFHALIVEGMHNSRLIRFWKTVHEEVVRMGMMVLSGEDRFAGVLNEHEHLVNSFWEKDRDTIYEAMKIHLENSYAPLIKFLSDNGVR